MRRWLFVAAAGAAVAGAAVLAGAAGGDEAADGYALFLGAVGMLWLVRRTRRASGADVPSAFDRAKRSNGRAHPTERSTTTGSWRSTVTAEMISPLQRGPRAGIWARAVVVS